MNEVRLIDANALKEKINAFYDKLFVGCVSSELITFASGVDGIIDNFPTVENDDNAIQYTKGYQDGFLEGKKICERPHGEWEFTTHHARRYRICPFCKCEKEDDRSSGWFYCWHCGADMRKGGAE